MIGNKIKFVRFNYSNERTEEEGTVIDAFTDVKGSISGRGEVVFGFGESKVSGTTSSERIYKVEYFSRYDSEKNNPYYVDIKSWQLIRVIEHRYNSQEVNEEKFKL